MPNFTKIVVLNHSINICGVLLAAGCDKIIGYVDSDDALIPYFVLIQCLGWVHVDVQVAQQLGIHKLH